MGKVTESIFDGEQVVIPMADVQHIEKHWYPGDKQERGTHKGILVITKHARWNVERDIWENNIYLRRDEADKFMRAWCDYRAELESDTLKQMPSENGGGL